MTISDHRTSKQRHEQAVATIHKAIKKLGKGGKGFYKRELVEVSGITKDAVHKELLHLVATGKLDPNRILFMPNTKQSVKNPYIVMAPEAHPMNKVAGHTDVIDYCVKTMRVYHDGPATADSGNEPSDKCSQVHATYWNGTPCVDTRG